jgi:tetratricopeptide (TPR) repeat protein
VEYHVGDIVRDPYGEAYTVQKALRGGFGIVYIVYDQGAGRVMAAKSFQDEFFKVGDEEADEIVADFYREAEVWVKLGNHENIVEAFYVSELDYKPHIFMEYVDGGDLRNRLSQGRFEVPEALSLAVQFCHGMIYANSAELHGEQRGIVHRDIKPENIMLTEEGILKITDFGLVKVLGVPTEERIGGTLEYMSPEQFHTMDVDTRSDIYSFGVTFYEMLTGLPPFLTAQKDPRKRWHFYEHHHREVLPRPPSELNSTISDRLEAIVLRCLEKRPENRHHSYEGLREQLMVVYRSEFGQVSETKRTLARLSAKELYNRGISMSNLGKHEEAIGCFDGALVMDPLLDAAWVGKGAALFRLGRPEESIQCIEKALEINPETPYTWINKGVLLADMDRRKEGIECFDRALELNPKLAETWVNKGGVLGDLKEYTESIECLDKALRINTRHIRALLLKGGFLFRLGHVEEALTHIEKALQVNPRFAEAWSTKGLFLAATGRFEEGMECFDKTLEINPQHTEAWFCKGTTLFEQGKTGEAIECFDRTLGLDPEHAEAWYDKGLVLAALGRLEEGMECLDRALEADSRHANAWVAKWAILNEWDRKEEAMKCFEKALEIDVLVQIIDLNRLRSRIA